MLKMFRKAQRGISLLEVMLSLSIIAIVLVMATRYFFVASNSQNINRTRAVIGMVVTAVHNLRSAQADYSGINTGAVAGTDALINAGDSDGNNINNGWGGSVTVVPDGSGSGVTISSDLPSDGDCNTLVTGYPTGADCSGNRFTLDIGTVSSTP